MKPNWQEIRLTGYVLCVYEEMWFLLFEAISFPNKDESTNSLSPKAFHNQDFEAPALQFSSLPRIIAPLLHRERSLLVKEIFTKFDAADNRVRERLSTRTR